MSSEPQDLFHTSQSLSKDCISIGSYSMSIDDTHHPMLTDIEIPDSSLGYPDVNPDTRPSPHISRRPSLIISNTPSPPSSSRSQHSPVNLSPQSHSSTRRSKLTSPVFTSLREKDDPYFLALPDSSRTKILSNSAPDLNTLPHPPPRIHRRTQRDGVPSPNGNGRLMEQLHSSRRHSSVGLSSIPQDRSLSRRTTLRAPFRLQRRGSPSSDSSSPNGDSDSESEIFEDDRSSNVGSTVSTRPSSFSSTASVPETILRSSVSTNNLSSKLWARTTLTPNFSPLDLIKKRDNVVLPERDNVETEDCRFLEAEYHRFASLTLIQQGSALRRHLLTVFARPALSPPPAFYLLARKCNILLKFQNSLLSALAPRGTLPQNERNTFLEAVACICERREWREYARGMYDEANFEGTEGSVLGGMVAAMERFREHERMSYHCVAIAMEYLAKKNFSGTAVEYCGRVLAVAFFYSPGVALRLIHALNVATPFTARLLDEVCEDSDYRTLSTQTAILRPLFPKHLHDIIYSTPQKYTSFLMTRPSTTITVDSNLTISFGGEWIHRWRAHNSDVFFSFLRHWHIILTEHLTSSPIPLSLATISAAPGYLVLQGHILRMLDSFIHRSSNELPVHPLPAPHHKTMAQTTLCKRAFERCPNGPLGPPMPIHLAGNRMQDSIHAMALLMNSGDGRPQGIEKAEKKLARAIGGILSSVRKTMSQSTMKSIPIIRPGLTTGTESDDQLNSGNQSASSTSEGDSSSTPRTVSTSDISSLVSKSTSMSSTSDRRVSFPNLHYQHNLVGSFALLFERTLRAAVRRTSVWEGQACFALCDVIERLIPVMDDALTKAEDTLTSLDWSFWIDVIKKMVLQSENTVTQVRAFGFLFNIWERCPSGDDWLLAEETWETFFCHWSTLVRCYFMNLVCWRICLSGHSGVAVDPSAILLLRKRLEVVQQRNVALIRSAQASGSPIPTLKASTPLPNRRLIVVPTSPSTHEYGITFDSIVPATPATPLQIERETVEITPPSRGSQMTDVSNSDVSAISSKEDKKGFRLNLFKGVFSKTSKLKKKESSPQPIPSPIPEQPIEPEPSPPVTVQRIPSMSCLSHRPTLQRPRSRKGETYQFSMQTIPSRLESNKGIKERPTPSSKTIEKFVNPSPVPLPRSARDVIRNYPTTTSEIPLDETEDDSKWRYAGRALAEWDAIVKQCDDYVDSMLRQRESIPEEYEDSTTGNVYIGGLSNTPSFSITAPTPMIENLHIPRMTVELPRFYFTGK